MSEQNTFYLRPLPALEALQKCINVAETLFPNHSVVLSFQTNIGNQNITINEQAAKLLENSAIKQLTEILTKCSLPIMRIQFSVAQASHGQQTPHIAYKTSGDAVCSTIAIHNVPQLDNLLIMAEKLVKIFSFVPRHNLALENLPQFQQESIKFQESILSELQVAVTKIAQFNLAQTQEQSEFLRKATIELEERYRKREEEVAHKRALLEEQFLEKEIERDKSYAMKLAELEKREAEHRQKVAERDARESTVVRRELLGRITGLIAAQPEFQLSKATQEKRKLLHWLCSLSLLAAAVLVGCYIVKISDATDMKWFHFAPLSLVSCFL